MAGRNGPPGDRYVRYYPPGQQSERYPSGQPGGDPRAGYGQYPLPQGRRPAGSRRPKLIDYPRHHRTGFARWLPSWKLVSATTLTTTLLLVIGVLVAYAATPVPEVKPITGAQTTTVYYSDGKTVLTRFQKQNRTIIGYDKMPEHVRWAVISAEDRSFYDNKKGVSLISITRAAWNNAKGGATQGGSTITQQYVKNAMVGDEQSLNRKAREFFISIKIARQNSKDKILQNYLNTVNFGRGSWGIQAAAKAYFNKDADKLSVAEGAYLAGVLKGPENYDPRDGKESETRALERYRYVLDGMVELSKLDPAERDKLAKALPVTVVQKSATPTKENDQTSYLTQMVRAELIKRGYTMDDVSSLGLKIVTTFDKGMMADATTAVTKQLGARKTWKSGTQLGLVSVEPTTGRVKAIYGGDGERSYNAATQDAPQAGSTFKPFALVAALEGEGQTGVDGISLNSRFSGSSPVTADTGEKIRNYGNSSYGELSLVQMTQDSVNTAYVRLNMEITPERTKATAIKMGIPEKTPGLGTEVTNVLGNAAPHVIDMASAYGTIANKGNRVEPYVIEKILNSDGAAILAEHPVPESAFNEDVMADATFAMQSVIKGGSGAYAQNLGRPAAGKTGTVGTVGSRESKASWFVGFTPQLSTAVVLHRLDENGAPAPVKGWGRYNNRDMQGGMFPAEVWTSFMKAALQGQEVQQLPEPKHVGRDLNPAPPPSPSPSPSDPNGQPGQPGQPGDPQNPLPPWMSPNPGTGQETPNPEPPADHPTGDLPHDRSGPLGESVTPGEPSVAEAKHGLATVVLPGRTDPVVRAATGVIGGPAGSHLAVSRSRFGPGGGLIWITVVLVGFSIVALALGLTQKQHCRAEGWNTPDQFWHACYSDIPVLYGSSSLGTSQAPTLVAAVSPQGLGQPPLTGALMWVVSEVTSGGLELFGRNTPGTAARVYFDVSAVLLAGLLALTVAAVAAAAGRRPWDAAHVALAPILVTTALISYDLLGVSLLAGGLLLWTRRRPVAAGVLLGLAMAAKPLVVMLLVVLVVLAVRTGRRSPLQAAATAVGIWLGVRLVLTAGWLAGLGTSFDAWRVSPPGYGSLWLIPTLIAQSRPSGARFWYSGPGLSASWTTVGALTGLILVVTATIVLGLTTPARPRLVLLALFATAGALLVIKSLPVQAGLLLLPLIALAGLRWRDHLIWAGTELAYFVGVWMYIAAADDANRGLPAGFYLIFLLVRLAGIGWILARALQLIRDPMIDAIRVPPDGSVGQDDPHGGDVDGAADRLLLKLV